MDGEFERRSGAGLGAAKGLDRDGSVELTDDSLARKDEKGHVSVGEMDDEFFEKAASVGVVSGVLGGPVEPLLEPRRAHGRE